jgi:signal transduction histidine kinase
MAAALPDVNSTEEVGELRRECARLAEALELAERDRQLLGYDLHDAVVQELTAAAMLLEAAGRQANFASNESRENYEGALRLLRDGIAAARQIISTLTAAPSHDDDLPAALSRLVDRFRAELRMPVRLDCRADHLTLPRSATHLLLRIAQESLHNIRKHARATEVEVALVRRDDCLELAIADNGVGFEPASVPAGHFGLEGIRARARALGARLVFDTAPNHGTRIVVQLPL